MQKRKEKMEFRYYEMPKNELVLALTGENWVRSYGEGIDYLHFHNFIEIGICHYGLGEVVLGDKHYRFMEQSIVIIPPNLPHTTNCDPGTMAYWEWMYFDMEAVLDDMFSKDSLAARKMKQHLYERPFYFSSEDQPAMDHILRMIKKEMEEKKYFYRESVKGLLRTFIVELLRMRDGEEQMKRKAVIIAPAIEYVEEHYSKPIKISSMAKACSISESHFRRLFLDHMNMKPLDYVNLVRVHKACDMMQKTDYSMEEIAYKTGFENISTFNRNFKKIVEITPYQWKKSSANYEGKLLNYKISAQKGW